MNTKEKILVWADERLRGFMGAQDLYDELIELLTAQEGEKTRSSTPKIPVGHIGYSMQEYATAQEGDDRLSKLIGEAQRINNELTATLIMLDKYKLPEPPKEGEW